MHGTVPAEGAARRGTARDHAHRHRPHRAGPAGRGRSGLEPVVYAVPVTADVTPEDVALDLERVDPRRGRSAGPRAPADPPPPVRRIDHAWVSAHPTPSALATAPSK